MLQEYNIFLDGNAAGKARITREGLYYLFTCTCKLLSKEIHRIILSCNGDDIDLGICVPHGDSYYLSKLIPIKKIQDGELIFRIAKKDNGRAGSFFEVKSTMPFAHICRLHEARFEVKSGVPGVRIF